MDTSLKWENITNKIDKDILKTLSYSDSFFKTFLLKAVEVVSTHLLQCHEYWWLLHFIKTNHHHLVQQFHPTTCPLWLCIEPVLTVPSSTRFIRHLISKGENSHLLELTFCSTNHDFQRSFHIPFIVWGKHLLIFNICFDNQIWL